MASLQNHLCAFYRRIVRCLFALAAAWLFVSCLVVTNYVPFSTRAQEVSWLCPDTPLVQGLLFSALCLLLAGLRPSFSMEARQWQKLRLSLIVLGGFAAGLWLICLQPVPNMDARSVQRSAEALCRGDLSPFQPGGYVYSYPHQSGLVLFHLLLRNLNPDTTFPFHLVNILCYMGILFCLGEFAQELGLGEGGSLAAVGFGIAFLPLLLFVPFIYGTVPGLFFSMGSLLFSIRFFREPKWYRPMLAALFLFLAVALKSNYQIFAIGLLLYSFYNCLRGKKQGWLLLAALVIGLLLGLKLPLVILEALCGCSMRKGFATVSWIAMGLRDQSLHRPGWYDRYTDVSYAAANGDPALQTKLALEEIKGIFLSFSRNPKAMISFFLRKNATQWCDPLFQSLYLNTSMGEIVPRWTEAFLRHQTPSLFSWLMNLLQTLTYGGLVLWAWVPTQETRKPAEDLLAVILLGGFVFHTFWEAKSQYTLPYVVLVLPLALLGYRRLAAISRDPDVKNLWKTPSCRVRFLMPVLLMLLAVVLSILLAAPLRENLAEFLRQIS